MEKIVGKFDEYNLETSIDKLRDFRMQRLVINQQLDKLIVEYMRLEETSIEMPDVLTDYCKLL